jgi:hypothetical protein
MLDPEFWAINEDYYKEYYRPPEIHIKTGLTLKQIQEENYNLLRSIKEQLDVLCEKYKLLVSYWDIGKTSFSCFIESPRISLFTVHIKQTSVYKLGQLKTAGYLLNIMLESNAWYVTMQNKLKKPKTRIFSYQSMYEILKHYEEFWRK